MMRCRNEGFESSGKDNRYGILQKNLFGEAAMKSLFEQMGGTYPQSGYCFLPDLKLTEEESKPIGIWGQRNKHYL